MAGFLLGLAWLLATSLRGEPVLRWAADPNSNAPYAFYGADKELEGFELEIINAVARKLGRRSEFVRNDWDGLIPGLQRNLYDCVICGIEITPEKSQFVDFSIPYYLTFEQFVSRRGEIPITALGQLRGRTIGTLDQTAALRLLQETSGVTAKTYDQEVNAYADVVNGRLDGVLLDFPLAKFYAAPNPALQFNGPPFGRIAYGIAVNKGNRALRDELNLALRDLITSGEARDILSRWGLWTNQVAESFSQPVPPAGSASKYEEFVATQQGLTSFWPRLQIYTGAWQLLGYAAFLTLVISLLSMGIAVLAGLLIALGRISGPLPVRWLATGYIEVVRGTPLLIQLLFIFYGLPVVGVRFSPFMAGLLGLGLNYAASEAENYRAALSAVPTGQWNAAYALGLSRVRTLCMVIVPQAARIVLPPMTNDFIALLKDSSLVSALTLLELAGAYHRLATETFDYFGAGLVIALIYLLLGLPFVRLARWLEQRLSKSAKTVKGTYS